VSFLNGTAEFFRPIVGFVGADPEKRQARNNGSKLTVLSVATQRSWKNAEDEWVSKVEWHHVAILRPRLAEAVLTNVKKGAHVLVEGSPISSTYEQANGKGKKAKTAKITSWSIRADVVRKLDRGEPEQNRRCQGSENKPSSAAQLDVDDRCPEEQQDRGNLQEGIDARDPPDGESSLTEQERQSGPDESDVNPEGQD
jgi:single-strand DNA-binding protein